MKIEFEENEFTSQELLCFLQSAYVAQINGKPFTGATIRNWIEMKHFLVAYGGYKILSNILYKHYGSMRVLTLEGLTREDVAAIIGCMQNKQNMKKIATSKNALPRKQRTKLYYKTLEAAGKQYTKKKLAESTLPLYWKEAGIKKNQMANKGKSMTVKL